MCLKSNNFTAFCLRIGHSGLRYSQVEDMLFPFVASNLSDFRKNFSK